MIKGKNMLTFYMCLGIALVFVTGAVLIYANQDRNECQDQAGTLSHITTDISDIKKTLNQFSFDGAEVDKSLVDLSDKFELKASGLQMDIDKVKKENEMIQAKHRQLEKIMDRQARTLNIYLHEPTEFTPIAPQKKKTVGRGAGALLDPRGK